jgi:electron transport complex protein RnfC
MDKLEAADVVLVFSCGVGVQTVADLFESKRVYSCCDTYQLPGFQGETPLTVKCAQCGECYLNYTGGICPITACSKSLVNGQCGGSKDGMCEVDKNMECGWERIYRKLEKQGRLDTLKYAPKLRKYGNPDA